MPPCRSAPVAALLLLAACGRSALGPVDRLDLVTYQRSWRLYLVGQPLPPLVPLLRGDARRFAVEPALPVGLELDQDTGIIAGTPLERRAERAYTVTARNDYTETTTTLALGVLDGFLVDDPTDAPDAAPGDGACATTAGGCTLRAALEEVDAGDDLRLVLLPAAEHALAVTIVVGAPVALVGQTSATSIVELGAGGAVKLVGPSAALSDLTIRDGQAGAVEIYQVPEVRASHLTLADNRNDPTGGAFAGLRIDGGESDLEYLTVTGNQSWTAPGVSLSSGVHRVSHSLFADNQSFKFDNSIGALAVGWDGAAVTVVGCTFVNNRSNGGGPALSLEYGATAEVTNSTFAGNQSQNYGGGAIIIGMHQPGDARLVNNTFVNNNNEGFLGAVWTGDGSRTTLANNLFVANRNASDADHCSGDLFSEGGNLADTDDAECSFTGDDQVAAPGLAALAAAGHGGPVPTVAVAPDSPAVGRGVAAHCPPFDARWRPRPAGRCTAGAYEPD